MSTQRHIPANLPSCWGGAAGQLKEAGTCAAEDRRWRIPSDGPRQVAIRRVSPTAEWVKFCLGVIRGQHLQQIETQTCQHIRLVGRSVVALLATAGLAAGATDLRLVDAAKTQDTEAVQRLLKQGVSVNSSQPDGFTALHWAAQRDKADMADALIRAGEKVNAADSYGVTPLSLACTNGSVPMVDMLLKAGADPKAAQVVYRETVLMTCARSGALDAVNALLARGADVNAAETSEGQTAVMWAAAEGHTESCVRSRTRCKCSCAPRKATRRWC